MPKMQAVVPADYNQANCAVIDSDDREGLMYMRFGASATSIVYDEIPESMARASTSCAKATTSPSSPAATWSGARSTPPSPWSARTGRGRGREFPSSSRSTPRGCSILLPNRRRRHRRGAPRGRPTRRRRRGVAASRTRRPSSPGDGDEFGVSGTAEACMEHFGLTANGTADPAREACEEADGELPAHPRDRLDERVPPRIRRGSEPGPRLRRADCRTRVHPPPAGGFEYLRPDSRASATGKRSAAASLRSRPPGGTSGPATTLGHIQATGMDARGQKYRYHDKWRERRDRRSSSRWSSSVGRRRDGRQVDEDLGRRGDGRERVWPAPCGCSTAGFSGSARRAMPRRTRPTASPTMRRRYVDVTGDTVTFDFSARAASAACRRSWTRPREAIRALDSREGGGRELLAFKSKGERRMCAPTTSARTYARPAAASSRLRTSAPGTARAPAVALAAYAPAKSHEGRPNKSEEPRHQAGRALPGNTPRSAAPHT